jgi:predicted transposase YbfD/YdcC
MVESTRELRDKVERETRFYISSLALSANQLASLIRDHWAVENV